MAQVNASVLMPSPVPAAEADRRLRPVLDALFRDNTKQALKLANQALQKRPGWPAARALHACILLQNEKWDEARDEVLRIRNDLDSGRVPIDEDAASKLQIYYQEIRQEQFAGEVYEQAWQGDKANVRLAEIAYGLYVRSYAFSAGQKIAAKLHKHAASRTQKYAFWASAALWLKLSCNTPHLSSAANNVDERMLKLACAMITKSLDSTSIPSEETVRFASKVYAECNDYQRAHDIISHPRLVMDEAEVLHLRANLPSTGANRESACKDYEQLLAQHDCDDWAHWLQYFECMEGDNNWASKVMSFIDLRLEHEKEMQNPRRGPFLAQIEILYREAKVEELSQAMIAYFSQFGSKTTSAHDIRPYFSLLQEKCCLDKLFTALTEISEGRGCQFHITLSWLLLWHDRLEESPEALFSRYKSELSGELEPTDRQAGDDYILLAAHKLLPMKRSSYRYADSAAVAKSVIILEAALTRSPFNFHFKLLLILLYIELGAMGRVTELWESLEVRHIQIATLSHLVLLPFFESGYHDSLRMILEDIERLWSQCDREVPDCVSKAFQAGSLNAAIEFINFRVRLENSAILARAMIVEVLHELVSTGGNSLGTNRALNTLGVMPRFTAEALQSGHALIANEDKKSMEFWELDQYDPNSRLIDSEADAAERYNVLSSSKHAEVRLDLLSLKSLLGLTQSDRGLAETEKSDPINLESHGNGTEDVLSPETSIRIRIASNLNEMKHILQRSIGHQSSSENGNSGTEAISAAEVLQNAKVVSKDILSRAEIATQDSAETLTTSEANLSPHQLRRCGRVVFDTLIVTTVAICSFSQDLVKDRKRMKKLLVKTKDSSRGMDFKCARDAILAYRESILSACAKIQEWISINLEKDSDWVSSLFGLDENIHDMFEYLPDNLDRVELSEGRSEGSVTRVEFVEHILERIRSSHDTCARILETMSAINQRLKLTDF